MTPTERAQFNALRNKIEALEAALGMSYRAPVGWGLTTMESQILGMILAAPLVSVERIMTALHGHNPDPPQYETIKVHIHRIRHKIPAKIENVWGRGWRIAPEEREKLAA